LLRRVIPIVCGEDLLQEQKGRRSCLFLITDKSHRELKTSRTIDRRGKKKRSRRGGRK